MGGEDLRAHTGHLIGVGVGPGDPGLLTVAAVDAILSADVVAYHHAPGRTSVARGIVAGYLEGQEEMPLAYPVTTGDTPHPGGYRGAMDEFYAQATEQLHAQLAQGKTVVLLAEGDPFVFSSFQHLHERLADRHPTTVIPGISTITAVGSSLQRALVEGTETYSVIPATLPVEHLAARIAGSDACVLMKLGRTFPTAVEALRRTGTLNRALYVERVSWDGAERVLPVADVDPSTVPYFSVIVVPSRVGDPRAGHGNLVQGRIDAGVAEGSMPVDAPNADALPAAQGSGVGEVVVVGLGPAGPMWLTPEARAEISAATDVVGYTTYVNRVDLAPGQRRHASDNKVESERAELALTMAERGARVVVVSSGDPGVFAMASAVWEVACEPRYHHIPVRVVPGVTAAHAAAARIGAPLGHDFATISLSDRLKPFAVVLDRVAACARADLVLALYNPASTERQHQVQAVKEVLLTVREPHTPVVVARAVGSAQESVTHVALSELDPDVVDMRTLLIVGASHTVAVERGGHQTVVYTPRRYG